MPIPFTLGKKQIEIPVSWSEITVDHLVNIRALKNLSDVFAILAVLTGTSVKIWKLADLDSFNYRQLITAIEWIWKTPLPKFAERKMPAKISFGDKLLEIPTDLNLKTFQQRYDFEQAVFPCIDKTGDIIDALPPLIAIYMQPLYTGELYNGDNLKPFMEMANQVKAIDAYPVGSFFLKQYLLLTKQKSKPLNKSVAVTQTKKKKQALKSLKSTES